MGLVQKFRERVTDSFLSELSLPADLAVLVIDMQRDYFTGERPRNVEHMIQAQQEVLHLCSDSHIPVAVVEKERYGRTIPELKEIIDDLSTTHTFIKHGRDSFGNPFLGRWLAERRTKKLFLMGVYAGGCVYKTAVSALTHQPCFSIATSMDVITDRLLPDINILFEDELHTFYRTYGVFKPTYREALRFFSSP